MGLRVDFHLENVGVMMEYPLVKGDRQEDRREVAPRRGAARERGARPRTPLAYRVNVSGTRSAGRKLTQDFLGLRKIKNQENDW